MGRRILRADPVGARPLIAAVLILAYAASVTAAVAADGAMPLNVKNAPVVDVLRSIADAGGFDIAIAADVTGTVTVSANRSTPRDLLDVVVETIGAAYAVEGSIIRVMKADTYESVYGEAFSTRRIVGVYPLRFADAGAVAAVVTQTLDKAALVTPIPGQNSLRVASSRAQLKTAADLIASLDVPTETRAFPLENLPVDYTLRTLRQMVPAQVTLIEDPVSRRILAAGSPAVLERIGGLIATLDSGTRVGHCVLPARYVGADSLADRLRPHLTAEIGAVFPDRASRSILVYDAVDNLDRISQLASGLDAPSSQVLIEARIVMVSVNNSVKSGIDWKVIQDEINLSGSFPALADDSPGFRGSFGDLTSRNFEVFVQALREYGETNLLSSPRLVVADHGAGKIHVGSQVPYKTIDTRETSAGTINQFEKVVIVDVGVKLEVTAHILGDRMINLVVRPEVSSVTSFINDVPVVESSLVESSLTVLDGNTVILGGLIKEEHRDIRKGVPILSSIPLIRYLFSSTSTETVRSELVILLTPRVLSGREAYDEPPLWSSDG